MATDEFVVDFPALFVAIDWVERHCVIPDGDDAGNPLVLADWQTWCLLNHYRLKPSATVGQRAPAFHYRRSQIVLPQKAGKAPYTAAQICIEGVGPALFAGWAEGGELYRCSDNGCRCGWTYRYAKGEAMGRLWPTPLIQVTATSEEQTDNIYDALRPMINNGPLKKLIPKTGEDFIRLPGNGRIDTVTSSATSRLGQRLTFGPQDETGIWLPQTSMVKVARTQRRGLAGMGGRAAETTNAWDPTQKSIAQQTAESKQQDIFKYHPLPPAELKYDSVEDRHKIHLFLYAGSPWVDVDSIDAEASEMVELDPAEGERFFGNRVVAGGGAAFNADRWAELADDGYQIEDGALVVVGIDGARFRDAVAVVATEVETGFQWPVIIIESPDDPLPDYEHDFDAVDDAMLDLFDRFAVWRAYIDPQYIEGLVDRWRGRWGAERIIEWFTYRERAAAFAAKNYAEAIGAGDLRHSGDVTFSKHVGNARKKPSRIVDDEQKPLFTLMKPRDHRRKIDGAMAGVISWEARGDAIAAGAEPPKKKTGRAVFV